MTEILWNTDSPHSPLLDHELVELRLVDLGGAEEHRYLVREIHAAWSASAQQIEWKGFEDRTYLDEREAERWFASRRAHVANAGFPFATSLN
ncbi:hypothetical protein [Occallatibacter savannae]|uniref:hypothetical protein n=1 Tax=Occallatibacter savannae TaxID=1002691 RepID=UPI000D688342|nr:hypothetical protein [Occallatibacter savannae]